MSDYDNKIFFACELLDELVTMINHITNNKYSGNGCPVEDATCKYCKTVDYARRFIRENKRGTPCRN